MVEKKEESSEHSEIPDVLYIEKVEDEEIKEEENSKKSKPDVLTKEQEKFRKNLKCARCGSKQVYTLVSGTKRCRKCSFTE